MALSATCGPQVLQDLIRILGLNAIVDGNGQYCTLLSIFVVFVDIRLDRLDAPTQGTVYFSSPLYRKNLHYRVVPKPGKAADHLEAMKDYILEYHPNDTGIIYCFTTKVFFLSQTGMLKIYNSIQDTEQVAQKLKEVSNGKIKTGVYHAKIADSEKENLHKAWRCGAIKVVCATIGILFVN